MKLNYGSAYIKKLGRRYSVIVGVYVTFSGTLSVVFPKQLHLARSVVGVERFSLWVGWRKTEILEWSGLSEPELQPLLFQSLKKINYSKNVLQLIL
jgi:hypothetical protein